MTRSFVLAGAALLLLASAATASESCAMLGGACRDRCEANEQAEGGAFEDCGERQDCCVARRPSAAVRCCIRSFDAKNFGSANCAAPESAACLAGTASPLPCSQLLMCR